MICLKCTFSDIETQECYLLGGININLLPKDKEIFRDKSTNTINKETDIWHSLEQVIKRPNRVFDQTATLIDHIVTNSPEKVSQSDIIDLGLSDDNLIYCTRKTSLPKFYKYNEIFVSLVKKDSPEKKNFVTYTCVNDACSDFIYRRRFLEAINLCKWCLHPFYL